MIENAGDNNREQRQAEIIHARYKSVSKSCDS